MHLYVILVSVVVGTFIAVVSRFFVCLSDLNSIGVRKRLSVCVSAFFFFFLLPLFMVILLFFFFCCCFSPPVSFWLKYFSLSLFLFIPFLYLPSISPSKIMTKEIKINKEEKKAKKDGFLLLSLPCVYIYWYTPHRFYRQLFFFLKQNSSLFLFYIRIYFCLHFSSRVSFFFLFFSL